jgi:hypothetical protein
MNGTVGSLKKINKTDKLLAELSKRNTEKGTITTNINEIQKIIRKHFKNLYSNKVEKNVRNK